MTAERFVKLINDNNLQEILSLKNKYEEILKKEDISYEQLLDALEYDYIVFKEKCMKKDSVFYCGISDRLKILSEMITNKIESINCILKSQEDFKIHEKALVLAYNSMLDEQLESFENHN